MNQALSSVATGNNQALNGRMMNGDTLLFATVGDPVSRIRMPLVMPEIFKQRGENAVWLTLHVDQAGLSTIPVMLRTVKNLRGVTITMPHKSAIIPLLDRISPRAEISGSVNMVRLEPDGTLYGDIADGLGFVAGLTQSGFTVEGCHVWLCGAGGVGSAIASALCEQGANSVSLFDPNRARADALISRLANAYPKTMITYRSAPDKSDTLAINASPVGVRDGQPLPFALSLLQAGCRVADVIMEPHETRLLREAKAKGFMVQYGVDMLLPQVPLYLDFFGMNRK